MLSNWDFRNMAFYHLSTYYFDAYVQIMSELQWMF